MKIYLDYNLFAYMYDETRRDLNAKVRALSDRHMFPYSPAHMEEIATAVMNASTIETMDRLEAAMRKIDSVSQISRNVELFPVSSGPMVLKEEQPLACFRRVVLHYDKNLIVEENEEQILAFFKVGDPHGKLANKVSNLADDFLLNSDHVETFS